MNIDWDNGACNGCPRRCNAARAGGSLGYCEAGADARVCYAMKHMWEEPCLSGERGSGAIFFGGCALRCVFCQNYAISHGHTGVELTPPLLVDLFKRVEDTGVHTINLVNGTHYTPAISEALALYKPGIPIVWNSGGYELPETLALLDGLIQVYLPDFKFYNTAAAKRYAHAPDYPEIARAAIAEMYRQAGACVFSGELLVKGVLIRHLILPGQVTAALRVLSYVREELPGAGLSMMAQYIPMGEAEKYPEINRRIALKEYNAVKTAMLTGAPDIAYLQETASADAAYVPAFEGASPIALI